ncbi:hypothetical protein FQN53_003312 [Emmonsiellopsis sp. PD_33]|nr:hypothetical protein FQN53_003312 [Emmonsiellopsis sp. PD_33]
MESKNSVRLDGTREPSSTGSIRKENDSEGDFANQSDQFNLQALGYTQELKRNRSMITLLFQALIISCVPFGIGSPLITCAYGGGQLSLFFGFLVVTAFTQCLALSLCELASRYPTSAGPYYWAFQLAPEKYRTLVSFLNGWVWLIANWTVCLASHFGITSFLFATVAIYFPEFEASPWQQLLVLFGILLLSFLSSTFGNRLLPHVDTFAALFCAVSILATLIGVSIKAGVGRHSVRDTLLYYDNTISGWGNFSFFIGLLPSAWAYSSIGMISSMAEECDNPTVKLPKAMSLIVPVSAVTGVCFILPLCATMPPWRELIDAPYGQALPSVYVKVMDSKDAGFVLTLLILILTALSCVSVLTAVSRVTWAFARDRALPFSRVFSQVNSKTGTPVYATALAATIMGLLGIINLGSSAAFTAFISVGVMGLALSYAVPIAISLWFKRKEVEQARWSCGKKLGTFVNLVSLAWVALELVLFSMPSTLPVTPESMNYAIVVLTGFMSLSILWYIIHAHKVYKGPPAAAAIIVE